MVHYHFLFMTKGLIRDKLLLIAAGILAAFLLLEAALRLAGFGFSFFQEYKNKKNIKDSGGYRILCIGDSLTALGGKNSYPAQLQEILNQKFPDLKCSIINKGWVGAKSQETTSKLSQYADIYKPDMIIAMTGINDIQHRGRFGFKRRIVSLRDLRICKLCSMLKLRISDKITGIAWHGSIRDYILLAWFYSDHKRFQEAEQVFKKCIKIYPLESLPYMHMATFYKEQGRFKEADEVLRKVKDLDKNISLTYIYLVSFDRDGKRLEETESLLKKKISDQPLNDKLYGGLALCYEYMGLYDKAEEYFMKANELRLMHQNPVTRRNYRKIAQIAKKNRARFVCVQYPMRSIDSLMNIFIDKEGVVFISNESAFRKAVRDSGYDEYFVDAFGGDFGHCTAKGNRLLAENIAEAVSTSLKGYRKDK